MRKFDSIDQLFYWHMMESMEKENPQEVEEAFDEYGRRAAKIAPPDAEAELWESVCAYGESRERKGFRDGFKMACQLTGDMGRMGDYKMSFDEALDSYHEHFGCPYPICIGALKTEQEMITEIAECIRNNEKAPMPEPSYEEGCVY